ncbi:PFL_4669 family integrating conjugative element protein [Pseudomonas sp. NPDC089422]|uniref:PFL_4669 family integrating conjugative element protein n=1 Tax=Pseudomonas sp. NPDC089422 TaxID=3364466 RepID=UPI00382D0789
MSNDLQLNLGALRSTMQLTLHTHHASRIWHGRARSDGHSGIIGLSGFVAIMNKMKRGAEQDDPYSDAWMLRIEDKLDSTKAVLQALRDQVDLVLTDVPAALSLGENLNLQPVNLPLFVNAQLGFMAVYLLADYDDLARRLILAHHTALIDRATQDRWLNEGAHALRSLFSLAQQYKFSGAQRGDFAANNAVARMARERFGELPQDVMEGTRRSRFAPPVVTRTPLNGRRSRSGEPDSASAADPEDNGTDDSAPVDEDELP